MRGRDVLDVDLVDDDVAPAILDAAASGVERDFWPFHGWQG